MQKGTVIEDGVMHRSRTAQDSDGAKPSDGSFVQNHENACSNPARNSKKETVTASVEDNAANDEDRSHSLCMQMGDAKSAGGQVGHVRRFSKRIHQISSRVAAVFVAAVMAVTLGTFASDMAGAGGVFAADGQSAYAATGTTPYTNIDVPLTSDSGNNDGSNPSAAASNSDNANPNRVETDDGTQTEIVLGADILGPTLSSVSGRTSVDGADAGSVDGDTYTEGAYTYERIKDDDDEDAGKVKLVKVDPAVGKVARIEANVAEIAAGAFTECDELATLIVFGDVKLIAKAEYDADNNFTQEGAFTDDQLKNVHVIFAITYLDETSLQDVDPAGFHMDSNGNAIEGAAAKTANDDGDMIVIDESGIGMDTGSDGSDVDVANGKAVDSGDGTIMASNAEGGDSDVASSTTPVDEGVRRLSGDVVLSAPSVKDDKDNIWLQSGFENIVDTPQIGTKGTAIENIADSNSDIVQGKDGNVIDDPTYDQNGGQTDEGSYSENANFENMNGANAEDAPNHETDTDANIGFAEIEGVHIYSDNLTYTLLPDYTLEVDWNGDDDMPVDLALPDYGQVNGTIYDVNQNSLESSYFDSYSAPRSVSSNDIWVTVNLSQDNLTGGGEFGSRNHPDYLDADITTDHPGSITHSKWISFRLYSSTTGERNFPFIRLEMDSDLLDGRAEIGIGISTTRRYLTDSTGYINIYKKADGVQPYPEYYAGFGLASGDCFGDLITNTNNNETSRYYWFDTRPYIGITVGFDATGGTLSGPTSMICSPGEPYWAYNQTLPTPTRPNYTFAGWYTAADGGTRVTDDSTVPEGSHNLYAHWTLNTHTITWNVGHYGGCWNSDTNDTANKTTTVDYGTIPVAPATPTKTGHTFAGWKTHDADGNFGADLTVATGDKTYWATYTANTYTVTLDGNGGTPTKTSVSATYDAKYPDLGTASKTGYTFAGWYTDPIGGSQVTTETACRTANNHTLYAHWTANRYAVNLFVQNEDDNVYDLHTRLYVYYGDTFSELANVTVMRTGYTFTGWYTKTTGGTQVTTSTILSDKTFTRLDYCALYAQWTINEYNITWNVDFYNGHWDDDVNDTAERVNTAKHGYLPYAPGVPRQTGHTFVAWQTHYEDGKFGQGMTAASGPTKYWATFAANSYTVTLNGNGGTPEKTSVNVTYGSKYPDLGEASRLGYEFTGWYTSPTGGDRVIEGDTYETVGNETLYAHWKIKTYTITLSAPNATGTNAASCTASNGWVRSSDGKSLTKTYEHFATLGTLPTATRSGYTFKGWRSGDLSGTSTEPSCIGTTTSVSGAATYTAVWSFSVAYNGNGYTSGTVPSATTYYTGSSGTAQHTVSTTSLARTNYNWLGWVDSNITGTTTRPSVQTGQRTISGNKTFYAAWSFSVRYSAANATGTVPAATTYYTGSTGTASITTTSNVLTRTHYAFAGWRPNSDYAGSGTLGTLYANNATISAARPTDDANKAFWLYATWSFSVSYDTNAGNDAVTLASGTAPAKQTLYAGSSGASSYSPSNATYTRRGYQFGQNASHASALDYTDANIAASYPCKWNTRANGSGTWYTGGQSVSLAPTDNNVDSTSTNIVLYGQWTLWSYIITYDLGGGEAQNNTRYSVTTPSFAINAPVRLGYDFSPGMDAEDSFGQDACGWSGNYNASAKEGQTGYSMARTSTLTIHQGSIGNITLAANWHLHKYWIRYNNNGDKLPLGKTNPRVYTIESSALTITAPEWRPYTFSGWTIEGVDPKGTQIDTDTAEVVIRPGTAGNLTFTAVWNPFNYEIQFDGNGATGGSTPSITTTYGDAEGWSAPACGYTREGFEFDSWNTRADGRGTSYEPGKTYKDNLAKDEYDSPVTLYATWTANPYFVEFNKNASDAVGSMGRQTMYCGQSATLSANTFTRTGYVFAGWSDIAGEGQPVLYTDRARVTDLETIAGRTHTLYACWTPITYTVQFNSNAPSGKLVQGTTATQQLTYNAPMGLSENGYIIEGYTFDGWTLNSAGTGTVYANRETIPNVEKGIANLSTRNGALVILYAQWSPNTFTVTYHKNAENNGGRPEDIEGDDLQYSTHTYDEWKALTKAEALGWAWIGHTFKGWYTEANLSGTLYENGQRVQNLTAAHNANVDLYAKWEPNQYRVTLDFKGGTHDATQSFDSAWRVPGGTTAYRDIEYGQAYCNESGMPKLARTGYSFDGWFTADGTTDGNWGDQVENADKVFFLGLADQTLYAKWSPIHFRVEYRKVNSNNQSTSNLLHVVEDWTYDRDVTLLAYEDEVNQYSNGERVRDFHDANHIVTGWKLTPNSQTGAQFNCGQTVSPEQLGAADPAYKDGQGRIIVPIYIAQGLGSYLFTYYPDLESAEKGINQLGEPLSKSIGDTIDFRSSFAELVNPGHELTHWYLPQVKGGNNRFKVGDRMVPVADIIGADFEHGDRIWIIPVWQTRSVRVTFDNGDGSDPRSPLELRYGETLNLNSSIFNRTTGVPTLEHCKFEGYWTDMYGQGQMLYNAAGRPSGENLNLNEAGEAVSASWNYVPDGISDEGTIEIKLYAKWTTEVSFGYPYGGGADFTRSYILGARYSAKENLLNDEWVRHEKETGTAWEAGLPQPGTHVYGYDFAGWYDASEKGIRLLGDEYVDLGRYDDFNWWEPLHLYGCWKIDVTFDYPTYPEYSSAWNVLGQNLITSDEGDGKVRIEAIQGQTYAAAGNLPVARRAGYKFISWNEARGTVATPEEGGTAGFGEATRAQNADVVTNEESYTLYLEYALDVANVLVERWIEDIGGGTYTHVEAGASGTAGAIARGEGAVGDAAPGDTAHTLGTEHKIAADEYKVDGSSNYYTGFTYERMQVGSTKDGVENTDGRVAGDGTTVVRMYFSRNTHTLSLADFKPMDEAGNAHVRGVGFAVAGMTGASAQSPGAKDFGVEGDGGSTCTVWYDQRIDMNAIADAGYGFVSWSVRDADGDVPAASAGDETDASHFYFVAKDSDVDVMPICEACDVEYAVESYFETLEDATHSTGKFIWEDGRGADRVYVAKTDTLTNVVADMSEGAGGAGGGDGASSNDPVEAVGVAGFEIDRVEVEDSNGGLSTSDHIENTVVKGDGSSRVKVFYKRLAYRLDLEGTQWADIAIPDANDEEAKAELHIYDENQYNDATSGYGDFLEPDGIDGEAYGSQAYTILYEAPIRVVARANAHCELVGFDSSDANGIDAGEHGEIYGLDSQSLLDETLDVPEDTDGLPQWDSELPYYFEPSLMPARDVSIAVQAQPVRATYISRYLFQDADPGSETDPAGTYTLNRASEMDGDASYEIEVTRTSDDARLLRYWIDGTDAEDHTLDGTDASADAATRDEGLEVPPTGFEPSDATDAITALSQLTPAGNETIDGKPANVTYSKYDRKRHDVTYTYAGGPNESVNQRPDGVDAPVTVNSYYGATVKVADTPQVNGWDFDGWIWQADPDATRDDFPYVGEGTDSESVTVPDADVAITGTWAPIEYELSFDGGTTYEQSPAEGIPDAMSIPFNSEWAVPDDVPARNGYAFVGWTFADKAIFEAIVGGPADLAAGDVEEHRATLGALNDFDGNPLLLLPGQSQVWTWWKGDRTLHAVWMRNAYDVTFDLGQGTWPNGTSVPLTYMTGAEVRIPQPASEGYEFTGWEVACDGSPLEGDAPAVSYVDGDPTRATINAWTYGNMTFTAKYDFKRFAVNLNPAGGTFDGEPEEFMDREIDYTSPDGNGTYGQATVHIPYQTEITSTTPLPEPERPGYDFSGWTDGQGNPVGWTLDDDGNKVDAPYTFDDARDATWVATWRAHRYKVTYDFGEYADSVTIQGIDAFSEYFAGMADADGNVVTSFMLPTASDLSGIPENVGFDGWYPAGGNPDSDRMRSFDPNVETGDKAFVAVFSKGANVYNERFWLEVLDQSEDVEGRQYAFIGETKFALDETLSVTRRTDSPNAQASMSAISGFVPVNPYDAGGVSIYPTEHPYVCVFSAGQDTVNGFYARETHSLTVGTANGIEDGETTIQVSPASALVKDADVEDGSYAMDESSNVATLKGASNATIKWGAKVDVGVTYPRETGYEFVAWQTDAGATPADIDVRANPTAFTMPDASVVLNPSTELVRFTATYKDIFGKDVPGAGQATFTVNDEFALKNLDDMAGHAFRGWEAYVADEDGNKLDPEANPVPETVGYDEDQKHMWVREGTATDLIFEAKYAAVEYAVSVTLPKGTSYLANGIPDGLPQIDGIDWVLMPGSDGTDVIGFNYTVANLGTPLVVDLTGINCAPYEVDAWRVAGENGESNVPSLEGGVLTLSNSNLGDWRLDPDVHPIRYELTLDMSDVRDGYVPIDVDALTSDLDAAGYVVERIEDGKLKVTFDVETASAYTLPSFEREDEGSTPEFAFRGWAKAGDASNASNPYILPPADIASWPKEGTVIAPVWARSGEQTTLIAHLPNDEGDYVDDLTFTFVGDALTPIDYSQDERFVGLVNDVDGTNVGYHLVWHGTPGLTDDDVTTLPTNFPESGTQEVWGEWVEDDDIITVGFGVKWDNSAPPGETKPRSAFALNASDIVSDDVDYSASTFSMRSAYSDDVAVIDDAGDAVETPIADANSTYYYIPNKGLYVKDANGKYHIVTRISNIDDIAGTYAGWRLEGFYLPIDEQKPERIIIGPDGEVDNATFVEVAGAKPSDLTFTVRWARISLVEIDMVGGYGEGSDDLTLYYWPEKDVFVKGDDDAIGDMYSAPRAYSKDDFNTGVMLDTFAIKGIPEAKEDADGTHAFIGYFGETSNRKWDLAKDAEGNPLPVANALALTPIFSYLAITDDHGKQVTVGANAIELPYGYDDKDDATAYDPTSKDGTTKVTWRAAWEGDLDAIYFNATVPMSMSFMVRADGTTIGPEAGAYQIRNYSNTAISVEDMTFEWAEESELEALFGKGATDALALSATPTDGQPGYAQTKVLLERANATQDAVGATLMSRYVFGADKWVIAKSVGMDPGDFTGDATALPALKLDYDLTSGGIRQLTQENASQDTTHPIGTLKFTLKTVR